MEKWLSKSKNRNILMVFLFRSSISPGPQLRFWWCYSANCWHFNFLYRLRLPHLILLKRANLEKILLLYLLGRLYTEITKNGNFEILANVPPFSQTNFLGLVNHVREPGTSAYLRSLKMLPIEINLNKILFAWKSLEEGQNSKAIIYGRPFYWFTW